MLGCVRVETGGRELLQRHGVVVGDCGDSTALSARVVVALEDTVTEPTMPVVIPALRGCAAT